MTTTALCPGLRMHLNHLISTLIIATLSYDYKNVLTQNKRTLNGQAKPVHFHDVSNRAFVSTTISATALLFQQPHFTAFTFNLAFQELL